MRLYIYIYYWFQCVCWLVGWWIIFLLTIHEINMLTLIIHWRRLYLLYPGWRYFKQELNQLNIFIGTPPIRPYSWPILRISWTSPIIKFIFYRVHQHRVLLVIVKIVLVGTHNQSPRLNVNGSLETNITSWDRFNLSILNNLLIFKKISILYWNARCRFISFGSNISTYNNRFPHQLLKIQQGRFISDLTLS